MSNDDTKAQVSRLMTTFPEMSLVPTIKNEIVTVDIDMPGRMIVMNDGITGPGELPAEKYCDALNTIALAVTNLSVFAGTTQMHTLAELTRRLGMMGPIPPATKE